MSKAPQTAQAKTRAVVFGKSIAATTGARQYDALHISAAQVDNPATGISSPRGMLLVVADEYGQPQTPGALSKAAIEGLLQAFNSQPPDVDRRLALRNAMEAANTAVFSQISANPDLAGMGCSIAAVVVKGGKLFCTNLGNSRVYVIHASSGYEQLSTDHTRAREKLARGTITPDQAATDPDRLKLTRYLGQSDSVPVEVPVQKDIAATDTVVLCTDGARNAQGFDMNMAVAVGQKGPRQAVQDLIGKAGRGGSDDSASMIIYGPNRKSISPVVMVAGLAAAVLVVTVGVGGGLMVMSRDTTGVTATPVVNMVINEPTVTEGARALPTDDLPTATLAPATAQPVLKATSTVRPTPTPTKTFTPVPPTLTPTPTNTPTLTPTSPPLPTETPRPQQSSGGKKDNGGSKPPPPPPPPPAP